MAVITMTEVRGVVHDIRIHRRPVSDDGLIPASNRLILAGVTLDADGNIVRRFDGDVTDTLTDAQRQRIDALANAAQQWVDAKL